VVRDRLYFLTCSFCPNLNTLKLHRDSLNNDSYSYALSRNVTVERLVSMDSSNGKSASWKDLFTFTTRKHLFIAVPAVVFSAAGGLTLPINSYLIGRIFRAFSNYSIGQFDASELKNEIRRFNIYTVILGSGSWVFNSLALTLWLIFGDLQARNARSRLFNSMIHRDIAWFDKRQDGVGALVTRLLT
jgi:ATP-binding cassette subfamily B (MDR/TAP) protein 1